MELLLDLFEDLEGFLVDCRSITTCEEFLECCLSFLDLLDERSPFDLCLLAFELAVPRYILSSLLLEVFLWIASSPWLIFRYPFLLNV